MWIFLIVSTLAWGIAEIFYKKSNSDKEKYSHLKSAVFVGFFMGAYALVIMLTQGVDLASFPINLLRYLPISFCYIVSMICSYFGIKYVEESICDPIENSSIAFVPILCAIFLKENFSPSIIIGIVIVVIGLICVSIFDKKGNENRFSKYGKKLSIIALCMPFCYLILDSVGTFLDIFYTDSVETTLLINVNEENLEHTANCAYEITFFIIAICILIFLKIKGEKLFPFSSNNTKEPFLKRLINQKDKIFAAIFETIGQATYIFALSSGKGIAAVILGAGSVIVSLILSRIILKEKLSPYQYIFIIIIVGGIINLSFFGA